MAAMGLVLLILFFVLGFFSIFFGLPGTWIILISAALYAWATGFQKISSVFLVILTLLAIAAEGLEYYLGMAGARKFGASRKGAFASIAGGIVGAILGAPILFGLGALVGLFVGAFLGAFAYEFWKNRDLSGSVISGFGAFIGRFSGTMMKLAVAIGMIASVLWRVL